MSWNKTTTLLPEMKRPVLAYIDNNLFNAFCVVSLNYEYENDTARKRLWFTSPLPFPVGMGFDLEQVLYWQYIDTNINKDEIESLKQETKFGLKIKITELLLDFTDKYAAPKSKLYPYVLDMIEEVLMESLSEVRANQHKEAE
jgi:hypothetical protein